jgi:hypothetical protein
MDAITPIVEAVDLVRTSRREKQPVEQMLWQTGMFGETSEDAGRFAGFVDRNSRSRERLGEAFSGMAQYAETAFRSAQNGNLFGDSAPGGMVSQVLQSAIEKVETRNASVETTDIFSQPPPDAPRSDGSDAGGSRGPSEPAGRGRAPAGPATEAAPQEVTPPAGAAAPDIVLKPNGSPYPTKKAAAAGALPAMKPSKWTAGGALRLRLHPAPHRRKPPSRRKCPPRSRLPRKASPPGRRCPST